MAASRSCSPAFGPTPLDAQRRRRGALPEGGLEVLEDRVAHAHQRGLEAVLGGAAEARDFAHGDAVVAFALDGATDDGHIGWAGEAQADLVAAGADLVLQHRDVAEGAREARLDGRLDLFGDGRRLVDAQHVGVGATLHRDDVGAGVARFAERLAELRGGHGAVELHLELGAAREV
ncbi:MAG: hypothetical protein IPG17_34350 [Sandaracinaceae bacterium]|nr:hypothetical protein [Sandaracinaceae bacterium]